MGIVRRLRLAKYAGRKAFLIMCAVNMMGLVLLVVQSIEIRQVFLCVKQFCHR